MDNMKSTLKQLADMKDILKLSADLRDHRAAWIHPVGSINRQEIRLSDSKKGFLLVRSMRSLGTAAVGSLPTSRKLVLDTTFQKPIAVHAQAAAVPQARITTVAPSSATCSATRGATSDAKSDAKGTAMVSAMVTARVSASVAATKSHSNGAVSLQNKQCTDLEMKSTAS